MASFALTSAVNISQVVVFVVPLQVARIARERSQLAVVRREPSRGKTRHAGEMAVKDEDKGGLIEPTWHRVLKENTHDQIISLPSIEA